MVPEPAKRIARIITPATSLVDISIQLIGVIGHDALSPTVPRVRYSASMTIDAAYIFLDVQSDHDLEIIVPFPPRDPLCHFVV